MSGTLEPLPPSILDEIGTMGDMVAEDLEASRSSSTWEAYRSDWGHFTAWCDRYRAPSLPAEPATVAAYAAVLSRPHDGRGPLSPSTIARRLAAIAAFHETAGHSNPGNHPVVKQARLGINRRLGVAPKQRKRAVSTDDLRAASVAMGDRLIDLRDRALLLVGYAGGFRRSELAALDVPDVEDRPEGLGVRLLRSKTDQEGKGRLVAVVYGTEPATCPVRALRAWLDAADITEGAVFRAMGKGDRVLGRITGHGVALVVKRHMAPLGHDITEFSGHSLRRGMATTAARNGAEDRTIMATTGHASSATLGQYVEDGRLFEDPASGYLGL